MPNPARPESNRRETVELSPETVALANAVLGGLRRQRPHDMQAQTMTVDQLIRMQLLDLTSRLQMVVPDYFAGNPLK